MACNDPDMRILVTGAAAGLAAGVAVALALDGHDLTITHRPGGSDPSGTLALVAAAGAAARAEPVEFLGDERTVGAALERAVRVGGPFDALVHAVGPMTIKRFERCTLADYHDMLDGNLRSAVQAAAAVLPAMRASGFGRIVFFGMNGSETSQPARGLSLHAAAKSALVSFARTLALEEGRRGITVNVVEPGDIRQKSLTREAARNQTGGNPRGRPGTWEDVADAVRFFVNGDHDFVNGAVLRVTGGATEAYERSATVP